MAPCAAPWSSRQQGGPQNPQLVFEGACHPPEAHVGNALRLQRACALRLGSEQIPGQAYVRIPCKVQSAGSKEEEGGGGHLRKTACLPVHRNSRGMVTRQAGAPELSLPNEGHRLRQVA